MNQMARLLALLDQLPQSEGVFRLRCQIPGYPAFFPGGRGYKGHVFPTRPVMLVGHNFDSERNFKESVQRGYEGDPRAKTWPNLQEHFLPAAGPLVEEHCFFTNLYLGAIAKRTPGAEKKQKNTGRFLCSRAYRKACIPALRAQVHIVKPCVIALLGANVAIPFADAFPEYKPFARGKLEELQAVQPEGGVRLQFGSAQHAPVIALAHPSNPRSNEAHKAQGSRLKAAIQASSCEAALLISVAAEAI